MAKLTDTIESVDSGKRIISAPQGYSFLGGLADAASNLGHSWAQGEERARLAGDRDVLNTAAAGMQKLRSQAEDTLRNGPSTTDTSALPLGADSPGGNPLPPDLARSADDLDKTKRAVNQGRATQDALDLKTEQFVNDLYAKHPERADLIGNYMHQMGYDHYMFRKGDAQNAVENAETQGVAEGRNEAIQAATAMGFQGDGDYLYQKGTELKQQALLAQQMKAAAEEARAAAAEGRTNADWLKKRADEKAEDLYGAKVNSDMGTVLDQVNQLVLGAGDSPENFAELAKVGGLANQYGQSYIAHLSNDMAKNGVKQQVRDGIIADAQHRISAIQDILSGPPSRLGQTMKSLQYFQQTFGLQAYQAVPYYSWLKTAFGSQAAADSVFGVGIAPTLSQDLIDKVKGEIKNFDPTKPNTGFHILQEIGLLAKGDKSLADVPEAKVTGDYVRGLAATSLGNARAILDPAPDNPEEYKGFLGSYSNMIIATNSVQPGYKDLNGWSYAINALTGQEQVAVLGSLIQTGGQFKGQAATTFQAGRAAVGRLLEVGRTVVQAPQGQGIEVKNGQFVAYNKNAERITKGTDAGILLFDETGKNDYGSPEPSPALKRQAADMNRAVSYLVNTAHADPSLKGISPEALRNHYLTGAPLPTKEGEAKASKPNWDRDAAALEAALTSRINSLPSDNKMSVPLQFKDDRDAAIRTIIGEAGGEGDKGMKAVAGVIRNRVAGSGLSPERVVTAPGQFEALSSRAPELMSISEDDPRYKAAAAAWDSGEDPTNGATHFYAPRLQSQLGRDKPGFDDGTGVDIGNHRFFKKGYKG